MSGFFEFMPVDKSSGCLICPICKGIEVHPISIYCNPAGEEAGDIAISRSGVVRDRNRLPEGRGVKITLRFVCENFHCWECTMHFHKGSTSYSVKVGGEEKTLWRD